MQFNLGMPCADLARIALLYAQEDEGRMQVEQVITWSNLEGMGDVVEAIGGIIHAWRRESRATDFRNVGDALGQLVRSCRWFRRNVYRH